MAKGWHQTPEAKAAIREVQNRRWAQRGDLDRAKLRADREVRIVELNKDRLPDGAIQIPLAGGDLVAVIDEADYSLISQYAWRLLKRPHTNYAVTSVSVRGQKSMRTIFMHRRILRLEGKGHCDHIDRNGLNNRRSNLRCATSSQNAAHRGPYKGRRFKGVGFLGRGRKPWQARLRVDGRMITSTHKTAEEAAAAYNEMALKHFGDFALLNRLD